MIQKLKKWQRVTPGVFNQLVDAVNRLGKITVRGEGTRVSRGRAGTTINIRRSARGGSELLLWQIVEAQTSETERMHYYKCKPVYLDGAKITAGEEDPRYTSEEDEIVEVLHIGAKWNASEPDEMIPYNRIPSGYLVGYETTDDSGATVRVGWSVRYAFYGGV